MNSNHRSSNEWSFLERIEAEKYLQNFLDLIAVKQKDVALAGAGEWRDDNFRVSPTAQNMLHDAISNVLSKLQQLRNMVSNHTYSLYDIEKISDHTDVKDAELQLKQFLEILQEKIKKKQTGREAWYIITPTQQDSLHNVIENVFGELKQLRHMVWYLTIKRKDSLP